MENNQNIEEIFQSAFANHEVEVGSHVWSAVQASIAAPASVATAAGSSLAMMKSAAVIGVAAVVAVGSFNEVQQFSQGQADAVVMEQAVPATSGEELAIPTAQDWAAASTDTESSNLTDERSVEAMPLPEESATVEVDIPGPESERQINPQEEPANEEVATSSNESSTQRAAEESSAPVAASADSPASQSNDNGKQDLESATTTAPQENKDDGAMAEEPAENAEETMADADAKVDAPKVSEAIIPKQVNYISADGDGTNDCFELRGLEGVDPNNFRIEISTRSGQPVFSSTDINFRWCGTDLAGNILPNKSVCYYQIMATDEEGLRCLTPGTKGSITVVTSR